jgi:DNA primase catalytic core
MQFITNLYKSITHEKIWGPGGAIPLKNFKTNSGGYTASCPNPAHQDKKPSFLMKEGIPAGKCQSCGYFLTWFGAIALSLGFNHTVKGKEFWKVIHTLANFNGGLHIDFSPEEKEQYELIHEIQEIKNSLSLYLHKQLLENPWAEQTREYLKLRGITQEYITRFPMTGFYPQTETVEQYLLSEGFSPEAIQESNVLQKCFQNNCLIFSYKDETGNTLGFKGRNPSKTKDIKYQKGFKGEIKDKAIMGLECCNIAVQNGERVICVEGEFDWLIPQAESIKKTNFTCEMVCFGGSDVKREKIETLKRAGAKVLYLSFDPDPAGNKATREAIKYGEELGLCSFVIDLPGGLDPADYIKNNGLSEYQNLVKKALKAGEWLKKEFMQKYPNLNKENIEKAKIDLLEEAKNHKGFVLDTFLDATTKDLNIEKNLIMQMLEKQHQEKIKGIEALPLKNFLPDAPGSETSILPVEWILNQNGLFKLSHTKDGLKEIPIAPAPFFVSSRSKNLDTRDEKLEITYLRDKSWKNLYEERSTLMDHRKIVQLSSKGFPVNSLNCKEVVHFINDFEAINDEKLPKKTTISGFGWKKEKNQLFFVMPDKSYGTSLSIIFEPEGQGEEGFARALRTEGDFKTWKKAIRAILPYPQAMFNLYASFTAPLLKILDAPNFIIDNWGLTSIGKTTVIEISASVWGLPTKEIGGLVRGWDATRVSVERLACLFNDLPIFLDDSQTANQKILDNMVYTIANGVGRQRGAVKGSQKISFWQAIAFSTGEKQLTQISELEGIKARIIDLYGSPFGTKEQAKLIHEIKSIIHANYGHAGRKFIEEIISRGNGYYEKLKKEYHQAYSELAKLGKDNVSDRLARYIGAVQVAGRLAEEIFDFGAEAQDVVRKIFLSTCGEIKERGDYPQRALEHIVSWVQGNQNSFDRQEQLANIERGEIFGVIREGEYIGIFPHKFKEIIKKSEFDTSSILKAFKERNWLQTTQSKNTYPIWFRGKKIRMITLLWNSFKYLWD